MDSPLDITLCEKKDKNIVFQKFCFILILIVGLIIINFIWTADKESVKTHIKIYSKVCDPNFPKRNLCPNMYEFLWFSDLWKNDFLVSGYSRRRVRSVLLDPLHVHNTTGVIATRGSGRGTSGGDDQCSRSGGREKICHLLPMGRLHSFLSGKLAKSLNLFSTIEPESNSLLQ